MTSRDVLLHALKTSKALLDRFTNDLTPQQLLHRITERANHPAWIIGHLIMTERNILKMLGKADLPALPEGFEQRYGRDIEQLLQGDYPNPEKLLGLWHQHRDLTCAAVAQLSDADLDKPSPRQTPLFSTVGEMISFVGNMHVCMHAGQITFARRSLGMAPVV